MSSLRPERCPYCNSKSGVDVHNRGMCHACHRDFPGKHNDLFHLLKVCELGEDVPVLHLTSKKIVIPESDINNKDHIPLRALGWLSQYFDEHNLPDCFWSNTYQRLCFPYYDQDDIEGELKGVWMRKIDGLGSDQGPKWMYSGEKNFSWLIHNKHKTRDPYTVVLCEDVVSALKISEICDVICLGGTHLKDTDKKALQQYRHVLLFLDSDAAGVNAARKIQRTLDLTHPSRIIKPGQDAKCYSEEELKRLIGG